MSLAPVLYCHSADNERLSKKFLPMLVLAQFFQAGLLIQTLFLSLVLQVRSPTGARGTAATGVSLVRMS